MEAMTGLAIGAVGYVGYKIYSKIHKWHSFGKIVKTRKLIADNYINSAGYNKMTGFTKNVVIGMTENVVFYAPCTMFRSVRNGSKYEGGSAGYSVKVADGLTLRKGASKGKSVANYDYECADGEIIITDKRVIFAGDNINFSTTIKELANVVKKENVVTFDIAKKTGDDFNIEFHNSKIIEFFPQQFAF